MKRYAPTETTEELRARVRAVLDPIVDKALASRVPARPIRQKVYEQLAAILARFVEEGK